MFYKKVSKITHLRDAPPLLCPLNSPNCLEEEFYEVRLQDVACGLSDTPYGGPRACYKLPQRGVARCGEHDLAEQ